MGVESSVDQLERRLVESERLVSLIRAQQLEDLALLDRMQVATGDGAKNLSEWTAARLDVSLETARSLVRTMRRTEERDDLREALAGGEVTFDRVEVLSRLSESDSTFDQRLAGQGWRHEDFEDIQTLGQQQYIASLQQIENCIGAHRGL